MPIETDTLVTAAAEATVTPAAETPALIDAAAPVESATPDPVPVVDPPPAASSAPAETSANEITASAPAPAETPTDAAPKGETAAETPSQWSIVYPEAAATTAATEEPPAPTADGVIVTMRAPGARIVQIAGDFNNWTPEPCEPADAEKGLWKRILPLKTGRYAYRFIVDDNWCQDPENPNVDPCPFGGYNSVLLVA